MLPRYPLGKLFALGLLLSLVASGGLQAQFWNKSKAKQQAQEYYRQARQRFDFKQYDEARSLAVKSLRKYEEQVGPYLLIGKTWRRQSQPQKARATYQECLNTNDAYWQCRWELARTLHQNGEYQKAKEHYTQLKGRTKSMWPNYRKQLRHHLEDVDTALALKSRPLDYELVNLGEGVNSDHDEYWPALTADENRIYFTRKISQKQWFGERKVTYAFEDIYASHKTDTGWAQAQKAGGQLNSDANEGAIALRSDGELMLLTICSNESGYGSCDLYMSRRKNGRWSSPQNLGPSVNTRYKETQPSLSYDGKLLYFSSNRPDGFGEMDLWKVEFSDTGATSQPVNLGPEINSERDDRSPFIHPDNQTLYFSSNGRPGMGRGDLFFARRDSQGQFHQARNMGYPINDHDEQIALYVAADGNTAYLATRPDSLESYGGVDIYRFQMPERLKPDPVIYLKGKVYDKEKMNTLEAEVMVLDLESQEVIRKFRTEASDGQFLFTLPAGSNYLLHVNNPDYLFFSDNLPLKNQPAYKPYKKNVLLSKLEIGAEMVLRNVFFETDSFRLEPESYPELDELARMLKQHPQMHIEVGGHTDNVGSDEYNLRLSHRRAESVYRYLVERKNVNPERLTYEGYGSSRPLAPNNNSENRAKNRRTTVKVVAK